MSVKTKLGASCQLFDRGLALDVSVAASGDRSGDHCKYVITLAPGDGFLLDRAATIEFFGEMERPMVAEALRWVADRLDRIETEA